MGRPAEVSDTEVIDACESSSNCVEAMRRCGYADKRNFIRRMDRITSKYGIEFNIRKKGINKGAKLSETLEDGIAVVWSDAHFWPTSLLDPPPAVSVLLQIISKLKPDYLIDNGDSFDGFSISRHPPHGWIEGPSVQEEIEANQYYLNELKRAAPKAQRRKGWGNHDSRFDSRLATLAPQFEGVKGTSLEDHFPEWTWFEELQLNDLVITHNWHGGQHAAFNNAVKSGRSFLTGHTHRCTISEYTDYNGIRYGIESGTLADPSGPQFFYTKGSLNWQPGFVILEFDNGKLYPERVIVEDGKARWRGKTYQ